MNPSEMAWALADHVSNYLQSGERHSIYIALANWDIDGAIADSVAVVLRERVALPRRMLNALRLWISIHHDPVAGLGAMIAAIPEAREVCMDAKPEKIRATRTFRYRRSNWHADGSS